MNYRYSEDMKYLALYWALGFFETSESQMVKKYKNGYLISINIDQQYADLGNRITIIGGKKLTLTTHKSFVILECVDKLLSMGYLPSEVIIDLDNEFDIYARDLYIKCFEWGHMDKSEIVPKKNTFISIKYASRLRSGIIERKTEIRNGYDVFYGGIFDQSKKQDSYELIKHKNSPLHNDYFVYEDDVLIRYTGNECIVNVPQGTKAIASCAFWDNQSIEKVVLPDSLISLGGDTFYNCKCLKSVNIPKNVSEIGNNPFAGCPQLKIDNNSHNFRLINGVLFNKQKTTLIYYQISKALKKYIIPKSVRVIGKHSFFMADNLECVFIPTSVQKLENNPFSGCSKVEIINKSKAINIVNGVIYNRFFTSIIGCLNSIKTEKLILKPVKSIGRNAFWNCSGIKTIVFPYTLEQIGYNPFIGCDSIHFVSKSKNFYIEDDMLFDKDRTKLICCPSWKAVGNVSLPDSVIALERGCFSGCDKMKGINLHNVNFIGKACFTNCVSLKEIYISDLVYYIGEWAFAYCKSLKSISISKLTKIDANAFANTNVNIIKRKQNDNILLESDNIYSLTSMLSNFDGAIDSIVIDPPYNSHIDYIGYKDSNYEEGYISFIKKRLTIASRLLSQKGFVIINIDDGECEDLVKLCKDIFGKNLVKTYKWKKRHPFFDKNRVILNPNKAQTDFENIIVCKKSIKSKMHKINQPFIVNNSLYEKESNFPQIFDCFGTTSSAKDEINELFGSRDYFSTPKPLKLIKEFVRATTSKKSLVLDFFAGSGTLGHAVKALNDEDGGQRKFILVSNNESNICKNVTKKRMEKIKADFVFLS